MIVDTGAPDLVLGLSVWNKLNVDTLELRGSYALRVRRTLTSVVLGPPGSTTWPSAAWSPIPS
ncbi:MAG: hypothetical protein ACRENJ_08655 [Candidatus Eiseniibacteriota bacterium]